MSRSYRKPYATDHISCKQGKVTANRWLRRTGTTLIMGQHCEYRKHFCTWDIHDYKVMISDPDLIKKYSRK